MMREKIFVSRLCNLWGIGAQNNPQNSAVFVGNVMIRIQNSRMKSLSILNFYSLCHNFPVQYSNVRRLRTVVRDCTNPSRYSECGCVPLNSRPSCCTIPVRGNTRVRAIPEKTTECQFCISLTTSN